MKENSKMFLLILLGMLTAFGPFVTDMYLPSLPSMGEYFGATSSQVQLGLTTSMIGLAMGQVLFGPLSDRYGRRRPLVVAMWLFLASAGTSLFSGRQACQTLKPMLVPFLLPSSSIIRAAGYVSGGRVRHRWLKFPRFLSVFGRVCLYLPLVLSTKYYWK